MDAELFSKGTKMICSRQHFKCWINTKTDACVLFDKALDDCCVRPGYRGGKNPVPIVEQWLAERQPKPLPELPELPEKLEDFKCDTIRGTDADFHYAINAIIDYLAAREDNNGRA